MWYLEMNDEEMYNAALVERSEFPGEKEYLFTPYSVFTVAKVCWNAGTASAPHEIVLLAASDNTAESGDLPLAPWY